MIKPIKGFALALLMLASATNQALARDYQVELLIFSHQGSAGLGDEIWPDINELPGLPARQLAYKENNPAGTYFTRLPKSAMQLSGKQASLRRSPEYRVLFHESWTQPVDTKRNSNRIRIKGGDILDNGLYELDGSISISRGRYLHVRSELFHSRQLSPEEFSLLLKPHSNELSEPASTTEQELSVTSVETTAEDSQSPVSANGNRYLTTQTVVPDFLTVRMSSARRMRSKELHYLDHPLFGALILVTPLGQ